MEDVNRSSSDVESNPACPTLVTWLCRYAGIIDLTRKLNAKYRHPRETQEATKTILRSLFPSWLPGAFKVRPDCMQNGPTYFPWTNTPCTCLQSCNTCYSPYWTNGVDRNAAAPCRQSKASIAGMQLLIVCSSIFSGRGSFGYAIFVNRATMMAYMGLSACMYIISCVSCRSCFQNQYLTCLIASTPGSLP